MKIGKAIMKLFIFLFFVIGYSFRAFPQTISWERKADMPIPISKFKAAVVAGKIYVMGGVSPEVETFNNRVYEYNPDTDTWARKADMPTGRSNLAVAAVNGKIYAIGGDPFSDKVEVYDPLTDSWDTSKAMPYALQHIYSAVYSDKIYIIGGLENINCPPFPERCNWEKDASLSSKNMVYDPKNDRWEIKEPLPASRQNAELAIANDQIYAIGGDGDDKSIWSVLDRVEAYNSVSGQWSTRKSLPVPRDGFGIFSNDNKIFVYGGWLAAGQQTTSMIYYDPAINEWLDLFEMPAKSGAFASVFYDNKIFIFGGDSENYSKIYSFTYVGSIK